MNARHSRRDLVRRPRNPHLAAALAECGITGRDLALAAGLHPTSVSNILHRRYRVTSTTARRLADALEVPVERLGLDVVPDRASRHTARKGA